MACRGCFNKCLPVLYTVVRDILLALPPLPPPPPAFSNASVTSAATVDVLLGMIAFARLQGDSLAGGCLVVALQAPMHFVSLFVIEKRPTPTENPTPTEVMCVWSIKLLPIDFIQKWYLPSFSCFFLFIRVCCLHKIPGN